MDRQMPRFIPRRIELRERAGELIPVLHGQFIEPQGGRSEWKRVSLRKADREALAPIIAAACAEMERLFAEGYAAGVADARADGEHRD